MSTTETKFFRVRLTHDNDGRPALPSYRAWRIQCESHRRGAEATNCGARYEVEELDGEWICHSCAKFDAVAAMRLSQVLRSPEFSHVTRRGNFREIGVVYCRDPKSPTGVCASEGFDPWCPEAMEIVNRFAGTPHNGPQSGALAGGGGW